MIHADALLINARLLTMSGRAASSLAILGDRIIAVGDDRDVLSLRGPRTRIHDLGGRLAMPGFTDSHLHLAALARRFLHVDLTGVPSLAKALRKVGARARATPKGAWITGAGFDKNVWGDQFPTRHDLDRAAPDHPVALRSRDGHSVWVNSLALKVCGVTSRTKAPPGGVIRRDANGQPTGILHEAAVGLVRASPAFQQPQVGVRELRKALRFLLRQGITSAHVMGEAETFPLAQELRQRGELDLRLTCYRGVDALDDLIAAGIRSGFGDEWIRIGGIKLLVDGALGSQTAWMFRPYRKAAGGAGSQPADPCGVPVLYGKELRSIIRRATQAGLACAIHAIGDRANAEALEAIEEVEGKAAGPSASLRVNVGTLRQAQGKPPTIPHRIEHAQILRPKDIPRFARLGVIASMQPCHILGDILPAERYWGRRSRWAYPIASLARAGVTIAFGSDAPVETSDPIEGIYAAVERRMLNGEPTGGWYRAEEGIGVMQALRGYTYGPAAATGEAGCKGKLAPGFLADMVVLSDDITRRRGRELLQAEVDMVFVGGRLRHRRVELHTQAAGG